MENEIQIWTEPEGIFYSPRTFVYYKGFKTTVPYTEDVNNWIENFIKAVDKYVDKDNS